MMKVIEKILHWYIFGILPICHTVLYLVVAIVAAHKLGHIPSLNNEKIPVTKIGCNFLISFDYHIFPYFVILSFLWVVLAITMGYIYGREFTLSRFNLYSILSAVAVHLLFVNYLDWYFG